MLHTKETGLKNEAFAILKSYDFHPNGLDTITETWLDLDESLKICYCVKISARFHPTSAHGDLTV
jgi:hypothetical protein